MWSRQLDLPVRLHRPTGNFDGIVGPVDRRGGFHEDNGFARGLHPSLGRVVGVIEPDADELGHRGDRRREPWRTLNARQVQRVQGLQARQPARRQSARIDIRQHAGKVADLSRRAQKPGPFVAAWTIAQKLHGFPPRAMNVVARKCARARQHARRATLDATPPRLRRPSVPPSCRGRP
jgi:hypothetical protein